VTTNKRERRRLWGARWLAILLAAALVAAACGDDGDDEEAEEATTTTEATTTSAAEEEDDDEPEEPAAPFEGRTIKFWSTETQPERLEATQAIIARFTEATGAQVELTAADENQLPELMLVNAASATLPDVVFHPIDFTTGWAAQGLLEVEAAAAVIETLGADTFSAGAIDLVTVDGQAAAVPSDGWGQLLLYRTDLFDAAGLDAPDTFDKIEAAADALHDPGNNLVGFTASTDPAAVFTQQTFEHVALANGCELTDGTNITLDSDNCVEAIEFFTTMINDYSVQGLQDVVTTRATYFAGEAAMIIWSPFILDEMAGLRDAATPACDECADNPTFLAENSGIVPSFSGPSGSPAQYGQVSAMGIGAGADVEVAQAFIEFWLSDGYVDWLAVAPEGKLPMRRGNADDPTVYLEGWKTLETGVDRKAKLADFYGAEIIDTLVAGTDGFSRWGFTQGEGELVGSLYTTLVVPEGLGDALAGTSAANAAATMQSRAEEEKELLSSDDG